jgi:hypothetical protein
VARQPHYTRENVAVGVFDLAGIAAPRSDFYWPDDEVS